MVKTIDQDSVNEKSEENMEDVSKPLVSYEISIYLYQGRSQGWAKGHVTPTSISKPNKVQKFQFQTPGMLLFTDVQKLYRPEILQFLPCMQQFLDNLWWLFIFSSYIEEIDRFTLDLLKRFDT